MTALASGWHLTVRRVFHAEQLGYDVGQAIDHAVQSMHAGGDDGERFAVRPFGIVRTDTEGDTYDAATFHHGSVTAARAAGYDVLPWSTVKLWWRSLPAPLRDDARQIRADRIAIWEAWEQLTRYLAQAGRPTWRYGPPAADDADHMAELRSLRVRSDALWDRALAVVEAPAQLDLFAAAG